MFALGIAVLMITSAVPAAAAAESGRIVGKLRKHNSTGVAGATVTAVSTDGLHRYSTRTKSDGTYVLSAVLAQQGAQYKIEFDPRPVNGLPNQWAYRKKTEAEAEVFTVTPGNDTVVNETLFPTGAINFTAVDQTTGAPISKFCVSVGTRGGCTERGSFYLGDLPPGEHGTYVNGYPDYQAESSQVSVVAGQTTQVRAQLAPRTKISTTVVDAVTRAPVPNACVQPLTGSNLVSSYIPDCSGPDGRVEITDLAAGPHKLWVQARDGVHGSQWVGPDGGTGSRSLAMTVETIEGQTTTVPPILLDGAGSISGTVVDSRTDAPVTGVCVSPYSGFRDWPPTEGPNCTTGDGKYTISGLGPYAWPLHFVDYTRSYAWQWSGDQPSQDTARLLGVHVGQSTTENARLAQGTALSGKVIGTNNGSVHIYNATTGDLVADYTFPDDSGNYTFNNIAVGQSVKVMHHSPLPPYTGSWYENATDFASARSIPIHTGIPVTGIDFTITAG